MKLNLIFLHILFTLRRRISYILPISLHNLGRELSSGNGESRGRPVESSYQLMTGHVTCVSFAQTASRSMATVCEQSVGWARRSNQLFSWVGLLTYFTHRFVSPRLTSFSHDIGHQNSKILFERCFK